MPRKDPRFNPKYQKNLQDDKKRGTDIVKETILTDNIADGSITASKFAPGAISTVSLEDGSVTTSKIANGQITDAKMTTGLQQRLANGFIKKQIVNRRPIITQFFGGTGTSTTSAYGPFAYNVPPVQAGAERRFRLYAVYSDNITDVLGQGKPTLVSFQMGNSLSGTVPNAVYYGNSYTPYADYNFYLPYTSGDTYVTRDAFSNEIVGQLSGSHAIIRFGAYGDGSNRSVRILYMEIQTLDVFP